MRNPPIKKTITPIKPKMVMVIFLIAGEMYVVVIIPVIAVIIKKVKREEIPILKR